MDIAFLALRLVVGTLFAGHGAQKLFGYFGGGGLAGTAENFHNMGLRPGWLHARAAGAMELGGGVLLALGLFTPLAAVAIIAVMTAAIVTVHAKNGPWVTQSGYEYNVVLVAVAFALAASGAGSWSLDSALGIDMSGVGWGIAALASGVAGGLIAVAQGRSVGSRAHRHGTAHQVS